jgi:outer membrane receptor protein involved in Fe transport
MMNERRVSVYKSGFQNYFRRELTMTRWIIALVAMSFLSASAMAGVTGKIAGQIVDKDGSGGLPGANVVVLGLSSVFGATSDPEGHFAILNVPAGTYDVKCSFIGYQDVVFKGIKVLPDLTTEVDFVLTAQALEAEAIEVVAVRPLVQKDNTSSMRLVTSEELEYMPVRGYAAATSLQAGVTTRNGVIYVRGGRFSEVDYIVDGVSQKDLQFGSSTTTLSNGAIDQVSVIVGGFEAEYGRVMSGVVKVVTREGGQNYSGSVEYITDEMNDRSWAGAPSYGYSTTDATLGGPLIPGTNGPSFFVSGERIDRLDRSPKWGVEVHDWEKDLLSQEDYDLLSEGILPHYTLERWGWQAKLSYRLSDAIGLKAGIIGSKTDRLSYIHSYRYNLRHAPRVKRNNNSAFARVTYTLGAKTFFTLQTSIFDQNFKVGDGIHFDNLHDYSRPQGNPRYDAESLFARGDVDSTEITRTTETINDRSITFFEGDEGRVYDDFEQTNSFYLTPIDFDLTSQISRNHQFKLGFDVQMHRLRYYRHLTPLLTFRGPFVSPDDRGGFQDVDRYGYQYDWNNQMVEPLDATRDAQKEPILASFYVQDKMEYDGLIINAGVRYDYLNASTDVLANEGVPLGGDSTLDPSDLAGNSVYHKISPRLGVGFPVTDKTVFHMNYGIFYQQPKLEDLYVGLDYLEYKVPLGGYYYAFGNPNLKPEKTTAYEVGLVQQMGGHASVDVTAYYKAVENLVQVATIPSNPTAFSTFRNNDYGTIKGLDFGLLMRRTERTTVRLSYSLAYATGTGSTPQTQRQIAWTFQPGVNEPPKSTSPLDFDQRHKVSASIDYRFVDKDGPRFLGGQPLSNAGINVLFTAGSGFPYTPTFTFNEVTTGASSSRPSGPVNSSYGPWTFRTDVKANKRFKIVGLQGDIYVWALNLFNRANATNPVYSSTGSPTTSGWLNTDEGREFVARFGQLGADKYKLKEKSPFNFETPRQVRFGLALSF